MSFLNELRQRNVLRVAIVYLAGSWLLIQVLETLFPIFGLDETSIRDVVIILAIGFIPALVFTWVFELTPEGIKRDKDVDRSTASKIAASKNLDRVIIVVLVLALGYFAVDKFVLDPARDIEIMETVTEQARTEALVQSYGEKSIAVLPFDNIGAYPEREYFSDGFAEELLNLLVKVKGLRVISRSSAFAFKNRDLAITEIADKLNVGHILTGSVRRSGGRIRITAQLIDPQADAYVWTEVYDREIVDIFAVQDEISAQVVEQLKVAILGDLPHAEPIDPGAYSLHLRARHIMHAGQWDKLALAEQLLIEALEIEPDYVPALTTLGRVYLSLTPDDTRSHDDLQQLVRDTVARISAVQPDSVIDLGWRSWIAQNLDEDLATAARLFEQAYSQDPRNMDLLRSANNLLVQLGRLEDAIATAEYVLQQDPLCVNCIQNLSYAYREAGQYDKAVEVLQEAIAWEPDRQIIHWALGSVLLQAGRPAEALEAFEKESDDVGRMGEIMALYDLGRTEESDDMFDKIRPEQFVGTEGIARVYAWTGRNELALQWLEKHVAERGAEVLSGLSRGFYKRLDRDPRFAALLRKYGQHPDQLPEIELEFTPPLTMREQS